MSDAACFLSAGVKSPAIAQWGGLDALAPMRTQFRRWKEAISATRILHEIALRTAYVDWKIEVNLGGRRH
jgi:hypothetical protein